MRAAPALTAILAMLVGTQSAAALSLAECDRVIYPSHGGERDHRDFGDGRVGYSEWWSQEGVYLDLIVVDCGTGQHLRTRLREERIGSRLPFDRVRRGEQIVATEMAASPALFSFERLGQALSRVGRDTRIAKLDVEPCACAALYPKAGADWAAFEATG